jgi:hypothetical protein
MRIARIVKSVVHELARQVSGQYEALAEQSARLVASVPSHKAIT